MLKIVDLSAEKDLDRKALRKFCGGQYARTGVTYGSGRTLMGALEEWAYYKFWY